MNRINPFDEIYKEINTRTALEKFEDLPLFPKALDIELTNFCNFSCLMCPVGTGVQKRRKGFMSDSIFTTVLEEASLHRTPLRFILWGEPTMHKKWLDYMARAKRRNLLVHFNTNGSLITEAHMRTLVSLEIESVKFSFQGIDYVSYREMRNIDYFDQLIQKIALLHRIRGEKPFPFIHVSTTITYETVAQVAEFRKRMEIITDKTTIGRTELDRFDITSANLKDEKIAILEKLKKQEKLVKQHPQCCPEVFDKLSVHWDGMVSACCRDFDDVMKVGDIKKQKLSEIWDSKKMRLYRRELSKNHYEEFELCRRCYDYHGLQTPGLQQTE